MVPRVTDLDEIAAFLKETVPEVKFRMAHGRMPPTELEDIMMESALEHTQGKKVEAARVLGVGRNTLTRKLKELDLQGGS